MILCVAVVPYIFAEFGVAVWVEGEGDDSGDAEEELAEEDEDLIQR